MMFRSVIVLGCILSFSATNDALAARGDPCTSDGQLKRWAEKYYDADYCSPTSTNTAPTLAISSPASGSSVEAGTTLTFKANAFDKEDGDISSKVFWYSTLDKSIDSTTTLSIGNHTITAAVYDSEGLVAKDSISLTVTELQKPVNYAPSVVITAPGELAEFTEGQTISLQANASDQEDGDLRSSVAWSSSLDGSISANTTLSIGTHIITAKVTDSGSLTASDSVTVNVLAPVNNAPTLSISSPTSGSSVEAGTTLTLKANAFDKEDGDISSKVIWYSSLDKSVNSVTTLSVGYHTLTAAVFDSEGLVAKDSIKFTVTEATQLPNTAPSIAITAPGNNAEFSAGQTINMQASASDSEDGDLSSTVTWYSSLDGNISASSVLSTGVHIITATVNDSGQLSATDSVSVTVIDATANTAPSLTIVSPTSGSVVEEGTALLLKASAMDTEDGDISSSVFWYSSLDGKVSNFTTLSAGEHTLTAGVYDSDGNVATDKITLTVAQAAQPQALSVTLSWSAPTQRADGTMLAVEDVAGYRIKWQNIDNGEAGTVEVTDGLTTYYEVGNLKAGSYNFTLNTVDANGLVSADSLNTPIDLF